MARGFIVDSRTHSVLVILGIGICATVWTVDQKRYGEWEERQFSLMEGMVRANLELQSIEDRLEGLALTKQEVATQPADSVDPEILERLAQESGQLNRELEDKSKQLTELRLRSVLLRKDARAGLWTAVIGLSIGSLMTLAGLIGWMFRIKVVKDRRANARDEDVDPA